MRGELDAKTGGWGVGGSEQCSLPCCHPQHPTISGASGGWGGPAFPGPAAAPTLGTDSGLDEKEPKTGRGAWRNQLGRQPASPPAAPRRTPTTFAPGRGPTPAPWPRACVRTPLFIVGATRRQRQSKHGLTFLPGAAIAAAGPCGVCGGVARGRGHPWVLPKGECGDEVSPRCHP